MAIPFYSFTEGTAHMCSCMYKGKVCAGDKRVCVHSCHGIGLAGHVHHMCTYWQVVFCWHVMYEKTGFLPRDSKQKL